MLQQFWKKYPAYNLNPLMRKRYEELMDARAFNEFLSDRRLRGGRESRASAAALGWGGAAAGATRGAAAGRALVSKAWRSAAS